MFKINLKIVSLVINFVLLSVIYVMWLHNTNNYSEINYDNDIKKITEEINTINKENQTLIIDNVRLENELNSRNIIIDSLTKKINKTDINISKNERKANDYINGNNPITADSAVFFFTDYIKRNREKRYSGTNN